MFLQRPNWSETPDINLSVELKQYMQTILDTDVANLHHLNSRKLSNMAQHLYTEDRIYTLIRYLAHTINTLKETRPIPLLYDLCSITKEDFEKESFSECTANLKNATLPNDIIVHIIPTGYSFLKRKYKQKMHTLNRLNNLEEIICEYNKNTVIGTNKNTILNPLQDILVLEKNTHIHIYMQMPKTAAIFETLSLIRFSIIPNFLYKQPTLLKDIKENLSSIEQEAVYKTTNIATLYTYYLSILCQTAFNVNTENITFNAKRIALIEQIKDFIPICELIFSKNNIEQQKKDFIIQTERFIEHTIIGSTRRQLLSDQEDYKTYLNRISELDNAILKNQRLIESFSATNATNAQNMFTALDIFKKAITIRNIQNKKLILRIQSPLKNFNSADIIKILDNSHSDLRHTVHDYASSALTEENFLKILYTIFKTQKYSIYTEAFIMLRCDTSYSAQIILNREIPQGYGNDSSQAGDTYIWQPHIMYFDCWDKHKQLIKKSFINAQYEQTWAQLIAATETITVTDNTVMRCLIISLAKHIDLKTIKNIETNTFMSILDILTEINTPTEVLQTTPEEQTNTVDLAIQDADPPTTINLNTNIIGPTLPGTDLVNTELVDTLA